MDLQSLQYQMWLAVKKHQALIGRRQEEPHNLGLQQEILDVLCQLVSINESQLVVARLREEREHDRLKHEKEEDLRRGESKEDIDLLCDEQMIHEAQDHEDKAPILDVCLTQTSKSPPDVLDHGVSTPPYSDYTEEGQVASLDDCFEEPAVCGITDDANESSEPISPSGWWCSPEKRLHNFHPPTANYSQEDVHDLVTEDEFMHALGLLTIRECEEVLAKRYERRKRNAYSHIFSSTIWEKPETRRKRRAWLTSGAGSPPTLRRKVRPPSQPPSQPQSRPPSPTQSSCSPLTTCPPSQPASPQSVEEEFSAASQPSEEICPMCKMKGADVLCDGCGVIYHGHCVDLGDAEPPPCWLCLTCEQLGLRASAVNDPQHDSRRREALAVRERLLRQRAELTITKLQLEERKQHLAVALEAQCSERAKLQHKEDEVRRGIHQLQSFIFTFQKSEHPQTSTPSANSPNSTIQYHESASVTASSPSSGSSQLLLPGLTISRSSSPSQTSSEASSPSQATSKSYMPSLTISCIASPSQASSPHVVPNLMVGHSTSTSQMSPIAFISSQTISPSSSPSQSSSRTSPTQLSPQTFLPGLSISPSSSPGQSYAHSPNHNFERRHQIEAQVHCQSQQNIVNFPSKSQRREAKLQTRTHRCETNTESQPTDLSTSAHSKQNSIQGLRRGESEAVAASI
ncbi:uncharacterized protein [Panulirus ornatus]|uniref:uncharacterized protein isoform X2 n=1 Tax=Panulirus ornatus TaxID=150431 RepID=UPI003A8AEA71